MFTMMILNKMLLQYANFGQFSQTSNCMTLYIHKMEKKFNF